jgi:hypothetical protein
MKKYLVDGKIYHFEVLETHELRGEHLGEVCFYAKCTDNGKFAWLDEENGIQFEGESRFIAEPYTEHCFSAYTLWGGEFRPRYNWQKPAVSTRW